MNLEKPTRSAYASRPDYERIIADFAASDSVDALDIAWREAQSSIETFPEGWRFYIRQEFDHHKTRLLSAERN